jgi:membrane-associated protease RseP (regulator of RpoE activity)
LLYSLFSLLLVILAYCFLLNFVLAAVNLLPIFITDGQRIFFEEFSAVPVLGKKKGAVLSFAVGLLTVALLVINALPWKTALGY